MFTNFFGTNQLPETEDVEPEDVEPEDGAEFEEQQERWLTPLQKAGGEVNESKPLPKQKTQAPYAEKRVEEESTHSHLTNKSALTKNRKYGEEDAEESAEGAEGGEESELVAVRMETVADAWQHCSDMIQKQIKRANDNNVAINISTYGDADTRLLIKMLLTESLIREIFLKTSRNRESWPRLKPLFGTPPYNFLLPEDAGVVRAAGMSTSRVNMAYDVAGKTATYSQFGVGHLVDSHLREYRILSQGTATENDALPFDLRNVQPSVHIHANVRVPKRSMQIKRALMRDPSKRKSLVFPGVGEYVEMKYCIPLLRVWGINSTDTVRILVKRVLPRSSRGSTAAIIGTLVL